MRQISLNTSDRPAPTHETPWQLRLFSRTLKKQQKLAALKRLLGDVAGRRCLLVTCGDNNGALNWHFRALGGEWQWADAEEESQAQIAALLGEVVTHFDKNSLQLAYPDAAFDVVMTIDVHEHIAAPVALNEELRRIVRPNGRLIVTTPGGETARLVNRIKRWVGMSTADYGHVVDGYNCDQLADQLTAAGATPIGRSTYSRFFTEMVELAINVAYVKLLARKSTAKVEPGQIAPQSEDQLRAVAKTYRLYALIYPVIWLISRLDYLLFFTRGYAAIVVGRTA